MGPVLHHAGPAGAGAARYPRRAVRRGHRRSHRRHLQPRTRAGRDEAPTKRLAPWRPPAERARSRTRFALVALQAALSLGLLATGTQFAKTVHAAAASEPIADPESLVLAALDVDPLRLAPEAGEEFYRQLLDRVNRIPGVAAAGFAPRGIVTGADERGHAHADLGGGFSRRRHVTSGVSSLGPLAGCHRGSRAAGTRIHSRRRDSVRTVIVNKPFADKFLHGQAIGRGFRLGRPAIKRRFRHDHRHPRPEGCADLPDVFRVDRRRRRGRHGRRRRRRHHEKAPSSRPSSTIPRRSRISRRERSSAPGSQRKFNAAALHAAAREIDARIPVTGVTTLAEMQAEPQRRHEVVGRAVGVSVSSR